MFFWPLRIAKNDIKLMRLCWKLATKRSHGGEEETVPCGHWLHFKKKADNSAGCNVCKMVISSKRNASNMQKYLLCNMSIPGMPCVWHHAVPLLSDWAARLLPRVIILCYKNISTTQTGLALCSAQKIDQESIRELIKNQTDKQNQQWHWYK